MATTLQIKRSLNTSIPSSLANGEFAYSANGDVLYIGSNATIVAIGGKRVPGTLTANQAMVTNATSYMDVIRTANLFIQSVSVNVINNVANSTVLGAATNSELSSTWAMKTYVDGKVSGISGAPGGSNTQIQFNDSSSFSGSDGFVFNKTTNNVIIANTITIGSATVNSVTNSTSFLISNSTVTTSLSIGSGLVTGTSVVNSTVHASGANVLLDTVKLSIGNSTVNLISNSVTILLSNPTATATLTPTTLTVGLLGGSQINTAANIYFTGANVHATGTITAQDIVALGNLTVSGTLTTIDATNLQVTDPLIKMSRNQTTADALDIGVYGTYGNSTVTQYTGFFRDTSNSAVWTLFNTQTEPTTTVDTGAGSYSIATLFAKLNSYGLVSNSTNLNLTGTGSLAVAIAANTLTLSTPLGGASGGLGLNTFTDQDILVANTTNGFSKLTKGADGTVLQISGTTLVYGSLDAGTF